MISSLVVVHYAELSVGDVDEPKNVNYDLSKIIKSLICPGKNMPNKKGDNILHVLI